MPEMQSFRSVTSAVVVVVVVIVAWEEPHLWREVWFERRWRRQLYDTYPFQFGVGVLWVWFRFLTLYVGYGTREVTSEGFLRSRKESWQNFRLNMMNICFWNGDGGGGGDGLVLWHNTQKKGTAQRNYYRTHSLCPPGKRRQQRADLQVKRCRCRSNFSERPLFSLG